MKRSLSIFLQSAIVLMAIGALAFMLWEPTAEGRNVNATLFEVYFQDPFLAYAYVATIPFFVGLYMAFKVLGHARQNTPLSLTDMKALRVIRYCAISIIGFVAVGVVILLSGESDDRPPIIAMGTLVVLGSIVIAAAAGKFERVLQNKTH